MLLHREFVPGLAIYSYLVGDQASGRCTVIDPTRDVEPYVRLARAEGGPTSPPGRVVLPYERPILVVVDDPEEMTEIARCLLRVGFDQIEGYLEGGVDAWEGRGCALAGLEAVSVHDLARRLQAGGRPFVLDVRTEQEWEAGHIEGAHHIHGGLLQDRLGEVPRDWPGPWSAAAAIARPSRLHSSSARNTRSEQRDRRHDCLDQRRPACLPVKHPSASERALPMALWLVTAGWSDDEAQLTQQWEVNVPTEDEAVRQVIMLLPNKPQHVEVKRLSEDLAPDLGPGQARRLR